eukprot:superscaffoldBa00000417_g4585
MDEDFVSCVLLLTLNWRTSTGVPVPTLSAENCAQCSMLFKSLLLNITELLNSDVLCFGITSDTVVLKSKADTALACAPTLRQSECLSNIMKDLAYYDSVIKSYLRSPLRDAEQETALLQPTLGIVQSLRKEVTVPQWESNTFSNRQEMCKMMRGFHIRTITINRAMGYISSGDHRK